MKKSGLGRVCILALALAAQQARAEWTLTTSDLKSEKGVGINEWSVKDGISFTQGNGALKTAATRDLISLSSDKPAASTTAKWSLTLRNGDLLMGEPQSLAQGKLKFSVAELGTVTVPLKLVAILQSTENKTPTTEFAMDRDVVRFKNGDTLDGVFIGLADGKVQIVKDENTTDTDLTRVDRLTLGGAVPAKIIGPLALRITLLSGTVLTTSTMDWKVAGATLKDYAGLDLSCKVDQIKSVDVLGGRVVWLADVDPAAMRESSFIGTKWPMRINANVMGGSLKIARVTYDRGLGVHTTSALEFKLDGTFKQFGFSVGMDDSAAPHGQADVQVLVDGKVAWEQKGLKAGQPALRQTVDVSGAHKLELLATSPGTMDVLGRVDWVDTSLTRP